MDVRCTIRPMTEKQERLALRKLEPWTLGYLSEEDRVYIRTSCQARIFEIRDASFLIDCLYKISLPGYLDERERQEGANDLRHLLNKYHQNDKENTLWNT